MKRVISLLIAIMFFSVSVCAVVKADEPEASPKHIPRIVSIVFDDSGSMRGVGAASEDAKYRWAYASYALQTFVAMMGEDDVLYVTYINRDNSIKIALDSESKKNYITELQNIEIKGGTPNRLKAGVDCLLSEYSEYKNNAKYYFVVMADGELDGVDEYGNNLTFLTKLPPVVEDAKKSFNSNSSGSEISAEFKTFFFSIGDLDEVTGIKNVRAKTSKEIITGLNTISAEIMGLTDITNECKVDGNKLEFDLKYPAHKISFLVQKSNADFKDVSVTPTYSGIKSVDFVVEPYNLSCPSEKMNHEVPDSKPYGLLSLVKEENGKPLPKGKYSFSLPELDGADNSDDDKLNYTVLVEPAVKIVCEFYLNDDNTPRSFSDIKGNLYAGKTFRMKCELREIDENGNIGSVVSSDVLNRDYAIYVAGKQLVVGKDDGISLNDNEYTITVKEDYAKKEFKIEVNLDNYLPLVEKNVFGEISEKPKINGEKTIAKNKEGVKLTKPLFASWNSGKDGIVFAFDKINSKDLANLEVKVDGFDGFDSKESTLKIDGNNVIYTPKTDKDFGLLPESFKISLVDTVFGDVYVEKNVEVIQPEYRLRMSRNDISGSYGITSLAQNTNGVTFVLEADYENNDKFVSVSSSGCESGYSIKIENGGLPGKVSGEADKKSFVPGYDPDDKNTKIDDIIGKSFEIYATANISGKTFETEKFSVAINKISYIIKVDNDIPESFDIETLKNNDKKVTFTIEADYEGNGSYGALSEADKSIYDTLTVDDGGFPGDIKKEDDGSKSFTPKINEGTVLSDILGKEYSIKATAVVNGQTISSEKTVKYTVSKPNYRVIVESSEITEPFTLDSLRENSKKVIFTVEADYSGDGKYTELADWDKAVTDGIKIDSGKLPGKIETIYDNSVPVGKAFMPLYDEKNNEGIPYTAVSGIEKEKVHTVTAKLELSAEKPAEVKISVLAPKHTVCVKKDGIKIIDIDLINNTDGVEFQILRGERVLSKAELEALEYKIYSNKNKKSVKLETTVFEDSDGNGYLFVKPGYTGWTFISANLWRWMDLYRVRDGKMEIILEFGDQRACANIDVGTNPIAWIIFLVVLGIILFALYVAFCCITRIRFEKGTIFRATFSNESKGWVISKFDKIKPRKHAKVRLKNSLRPFKHMCRNVEVLANDVLLTTEEGRGATTYPYFVDKPDDGAAKSKFNSGVLSSIDIEKILSKSSKPFKKGVIEGKSMKFTPEEDIIICLSDGTFISEVTETKIAIIFFISDNEMKNFYNN